jgi:hypothetical protein
MDTFDTPTPSLRAQLNALHLSTCEWSLSMSLRISEAHGRYVLTGYAHDNANFLEASAIVLCRHLALWKFDQLQREAAARIRALHADPAVRQAIRLADAPAPLHFDFGMGPDRHTSLSNTDWGDQTDDAYFHLMDCGNALQLQLSDLIDATAARMAQGAATL